MNDFTFLYVKDNSTARSDLSVQRVLKLRNDPDSSPDNFFEKSANNYGDANIYCTIANVH